MKVPSSRLGFTLIELLVVIAIIAILAAILFPVFAQVREKARAISCESNEKQVALGILEYVQDYDEYFPMADTQVGGYTWQVAVQPYIKNGNTGQAWEGSEGGGVWTCPDSPIANYDSYAPPSDMIPMFWSKPGGSSNKVSSISAVVAPSDKILLFDMGDNVSVAGALPMMIEGSWQWFNAARSPYPSAYTYPIGSDWAAAHGNCDDKGSYDWWGGCAFYPNARHQNRGNYAFFDGHVHSLPKNGINWYVNVYNQPTDGLGW